MLRQLACAFVVVAVSVGLVMADDKAQAKAKPKTQNHNGKIVKVDQAAGTVTVSVKGKKGEEPKDQTFTISDTTKFQIFAPGAEKPEPLTGKDALKNPQVKEGTAIQVVTNDQNQVVRVRVGTAPKKPKK